MINKKIKKLLLILFSLVLLFTSTVQPFVPITHATDTNTWYTQNPVDWMVKVYDDTNPSEIFGERYTAAQTQWIIWGVLTTPFVFLGDTNRKGVICLMGMISNNNNDIISCSPLVLAILDPITKFFDKITVNPDNKTPFAMMTDFNNHSFSGVAYLSSKLEKFSITPQVHAQSSGFGYGELNKNFSKYWAGTRDIAYALSVLIVIIFAFMIMFRVKISPQIVITVQSALPKVIGALILATFSFAIAGFLIDLMYVVSGLFASLLVTAGFASDWSLTYSIINPNNSLDFGLYILVYMFEYCVLFLVALVLAALTSLVSLTGTIPGAFWSLLMVLVLIWCIILMFFYAFKIPWILIKNLISIYVSIVIAPIQIMAGAFVPKIGFGQWIRKLTAEILVYPVTGLLMLFAFKLLLTSMKFSGLNLLNFAGIGVIISNIAALFGSEFSVNSVWIPPIIGSSSAITPFLFMLASFGIIVALPKVVDIMKMAIMGTKFDYGTAIGEAVSPLQWGQRQVMGSPIARTFSEGIGYSGAAKVLQRASNSPFWGNVLNKTERITGINSTNAGAVANTWREKVGQRKVTTDKDNSVGR